MVELVPPFIEQVFGHLLDRLDAVIHLCDTVLCVIDRALQSLAGLLEIAAVNLDQRGELDTHVQPEVFQVDPQKGLAGLRKVLKLYADQGWKPVVAPELEFFLVAKNTDPDYPLEPPIGRSGRAEVGRKSYSISAVNEFDPFFF